VSRNLEFEIDALHPRCIMLNAEARLSRYLRRDISVIARSLRGSITR